MQVHAIKRAKGHYQIVSDRSQIVVANIIGVSGQWNVFTPGGELDAYCGTLAGAKDTGIAWADARTFCHGGCGWIVRHPDTHCAQCGVGQTNVFGAV